MKTYKNLWSDFISKDNIIKSIKNASKGKKKKRLDVCRVLYMLRSNPDGLVKRFQEYAANYQNDWHESIEIYDGISRKKRTIIVPSFRELVIQHMLVNVLKPMFLKGVYERSYGSIPKRGAHSGKKVIEKWIRDDIKNCKFVVKLDIRKYFESIPHELLKRKLARELKDGKILVILFKIINVVQKGIPLGFYTSQWLSMWYLKDFDHFVKEHLYSPHYIRYADDLVILGSNKRKLWNTYNQIIIELKKLGLELNERSQLFRFSYNVGKRIHGRDVDFMGFRFFRNKTILRRSIYYKMCRKAKKISKKTKATIYELRQMLSYLGWIKDTQVYNAYKEHIKPFFDFQYAKKRISQYDKRRNQNENYKNQISTSH